MKKISKLILINISVTIFLLIIIEFTSMIILKYYKKETKFLINLNSDKNVYLKDPCQRMMTHPILDRIHDHGNKCKIKGGYASGEFVFYDKIPNNKEYIVTLGGSTTDGFYNHLSSGETWPYHISKLIKKDNLKLSVVNGGVGGYSSRQELLKLLNSVNNLNLKIKYIISLNGINDIEGYNSNELIDNNFPYLTTTTLKMFNEERWIVQNKKKIDFFPSSKLFLYFLNKKIFKFSYLENLYENNIELKKEKINATISLFNTKTISPSEIWEKNILLMNEIAKLNGWKYFVFIQPTMGLENISVSAAEGSNDRKLYDRLKYSKDYLKRLNDFYESARLLCKRIDFCYDISDVAPPSGNVFNDPRHHNSNGNKLIAESIYKTIFNH